MAQNTDEANSKSKNRLGIMAGPSFPTGDFASKNPRRSSAAHAKTGYLIELNYQHELSEHLGIKLLLRRNNYNVETQAMADYLSKRTHQTEINIYSDNFLLHAFMGGIYTQFPINKSSDIYFKMNAILGVVNSIYPRQTIHAGQNGSYIEFASSEAKVNSIGYGLGLGLMFPLEEKVDFAVNVDFTGAEPNFEDVDVYVLFDNGSTDHTTDNLRQPIQTFNVGLGLIMHL